MCKINKVLIIVVLSAVICTVCDEVPQVDSFSTKIVGGAADKVDKAPYQVSMQVLIERGNASRHYHFCSGSILTPNYVLTAAHCLSGIASERISVLAGTKVWDQGGVRRSVDHYEVHERYQKLKGWDIGLITLSAPFEFGPKISSIKFDDHFVEPDVDCILTGWGYTLPLRDYGIVPKWIHAILKSYPKDLQITRLTSISNAECRQTYGSMPLETELCTYKWGTGACSGDSGGPLVNLKRNKLLGVVSFGFVYCGGFTGFPDGFTRVSNFTGWINERINVPPMLLLKTKSLSDTEIVNK